MAYYKCGRVYTTQNSNTVIDTASGAIANFSTQFAMPLIKSRFNFKATQEAGTPTPQSPKSISGVSAVSIVRCGKNLYQYDESKIDARTTTSGTTRAYLDLGLNGASSFVISANLKDGETPTNTNINIAKIRTDGLLEVVNTFILAQTQSIYTRTVSISNGERLLLSMSHDSVENAKANIPKYNIQVEIGSTETTYEPYNGSTTLINLGGTYYGGYVEQDKDGHRQLVVTHSDSVDLNTLTFYRATFSGNSGFYADLPNGLIKGTGSATIDGLCTNYKVTSQASMPEDKSCRFYSHTDWGGFSRIAIRDDDTIDMTGEEFTAYVTGQICYEIQNPQTIALPDGEPIKTLPGINNIYADTGDTTVEYRNLTQGG